MTKKLKQIWKTFNNGEFFFLILIIIPLLFFALFLFDKSIFFSIVINLITIDAVLGLARSDNPNIVWTDINFVKVSWLKTPYIFGRYVFANKIMNRINVLRISNHQHDCGFFVYLILYSIEYIFRLGKTDKISFNCVSGKENYDWLLYLLKIKR